jgi:hypothetical protein
MAFLSQDEVNNLSCKLARFQPRELFGEKIEEILADVLPGAERLPKDKKWFDLIQPSRALEVKTFEANPPLKVGTTVYNVLKRVSKIETKDRNGKLRNAQEVGNEVIDYLNESIKEHAKLKRVPNKYIVAVLFRTANGESYAYWEEPLNYGATKDYTWSWNDGETLKGYRDQQAIFQWYSKNQKQLFYRWQIPKNANFFSVKPIKCLNITEKELNDERKKWYYKGFDDATAGLKPNF